MISDEVSREDEKDDYPFLAFWIPANELIMDVAA